MGEEDQCAVVIDTGSNTVKAGFAGDDVPLAVFRSVVGRSKHRCRLRVGCEIKDVYVGEEALANQQKEELYLKYPVKDGVVAMEHLGGGRSVPLWDDMEKLWFHVFYDKLRVSPEEHPVLLTEALAVSKAYREKTAQIMFEYFTVPALYLKSQSTLAMFGYGSTNGIVLDLGATSSCITPIYDGDAVSAANATQRIKVGGHHLTEYMMRLLSSDRFSFSTMAEREIACGIKEKLAHVTLDYDAEKKAHEKSSRGGKKYKLPDGREIKLGHASFSCPEALFNPGLIGSDAAGVHHALYNSVMACDVSIRHHLFARIILAGGSSLIPGIDNRLGKEMNTLAPLGMKVKVMAMPNRQYATWIGGSILSSLDSFQRMWVTMEEFEDVGPSIVSRKCL